MIPESTTQDIGQALLPYVRQVMAVHSVVRAPAGAEAAVQFIGRLSIDSEQAYERLARDFERFGRTLLLRTDGVDQVAVAAPGVIRPAPSNPWVNVALFGLTLASVLFSGLLNGASYVFPQAAGLTTRLLFHPRVVGLGLLFTAAFLGILVCHEFGHYLAARWHGTAVTLPYFLPLPGSQLGTLGAFIRLKAPPRNRKVLLDIGMAGPLAGFAVTVPVLLLGLALSQVVRLPSTPAGFRSIMLEGNSVFYLLAKFIVHGQLLPAPASYGGVPPLLYWLRYLFLGLPAPLGGQDILLHPLAWAGWTGLLVTCLNLIPAGQLDGGHALYVLLGRRASLLWPVLIVGLVLMGMVWSGWWIWAALLFLLGRVHATPLDDVTRLDPGRRLIALSGIVLFFLLFTPIPLRTFGF